MVLAGIPQGRRLRDDAKKLEIERNLETEGALVWPAPTANRSTWVRD